MTMFTVALNLRTRLEAPRRCPDCLDVDLVAGWHGDLMVLRCPECRRCWDPELGRLSPVMPEPRRARALRP